LCLFYSWVILFLPDTSDKFCIYKKKSNYCRRAIGYPFYLSIIFRASPSFWKNSSLDTILEKKTMASLDKKASLIVKHGGSTFIKNTHKVRFVIICILILSIIYILQHLIKNYWLSYFGGLLMIFLMPREDPDILMSVCLLWGSFFLYKLFQKPLNCKWWILAASISFSLLSFIQPLFQYFSIILLITSGIIQVFEKKKAPFLKKTILLILIINMLCLPWALRNYIKCDSFCLSKRKVEILRIRSSFLDMTNKEFLAGFLHFLTNEPYYLKTKILSLVNVDNKVFARFIKKNKDSFYYKGKHNTDDAIKYLDNSSYKKETALWNIFKINFKNSIQKHKLSDELIDLVEKITSLKTYDMKKIDYLIKSKSKIIRHEFEAVILSELQFNHKLNKQYHKLTAQNNIAVYKKMNTHWAKNLFISPLFAFRGSFSDVRYNLLLSKYFLYNLIRTGIVWIRLLFVPILFFVFISACKKRNYNKLMLFLPTIYGFTLLSVTTHFIPRYSRLFQPIYILAFCYFISTYYRLIKNNNFLCYHKPIIFKK
jgi:hypothetical protein